MPSSNAANHPIAPPPLLLPPVVAAADTVMEAVAASDRPLGSETASWNRNKLSELLLGARKVAVEEFALLKVTVAPMVCDQA